MFDGFNGDIWMSYWILKDEALDFDKRSAIFMAALMDFDELRWIFMDFHWDKC